MQRTKDRDNSPIYFFWIDNYFAPDMAEILNEVFWAYEVDSLLDLSDEDKLLRMNAEQRLDTYESVLALHELHNAQARRRKLRQKDEAHQSSFWRRGHRANLKSI